MPDFLIAGHVANLTTGAAMLKGIRDYEKYHLGRSRLNRTASIGWWRAPGNSLVSRGGLDQVRPEPRGNFIAIEKL